MKKSVLLRKAKKYIEEGDHKYICDAITEVGWDSAASEEAAEIRRWIHNDLLYPNYWSYGDWLIKNHPELAIEGKAGEYVGARLQWVDWMIQFWESKGD